FSGTKCCNLSEAEIRSRFFLRVASNRWLRRESWARSTSRCGCASKTTIAERYFSAPQAIRCRRNRGTSHFVCEQTSTKAKRDWKCSLRRCAKRNWAADENFAALG